MNKITVSIIGLLLIAVGVFVVTSKNNPTVQSSDLQVNTISSSANTQESIERYVEYSEENLASTKDTKQVVFFHAPWCSTCNEFEKEIIAQGVPEGITILKADYDNDTDLKQKYGVRLQSTFVLLDENGEVENTWPFGQGLDNNISNLYDQVI